MSDALTGDYSPTNPPEKQRISAASAARGSYWGFSPGQHVKGDSKHKNHADKGVALEKRFVDAGKIES